MNSSPLGKARWLIENSQYMAVATADGTGKPWISPVFFAYDHKYNFYWVSYINALHSQNIRTRPEVALSIYGPVDETGEIWDGVYLDAVATELEDEQDIQKAMVALRSRPQHSKFTIDSVDDVRGTAAWRIYQATPKKAYKRSDRDEVISGQHITTKTEINLGDLR